MEQKFLKSWKKYFGKAGLPLVFYYTDELEKGTELIKATKGHLCMVATLVKARKGKTIAFGENSFSCHGGKTYLGFGNAMRPGFEYFLSCGIPGQMEGERYKKTPDIVREMMSNNIIFNAPKKYIVFKRWDKLEEKDEPEAVIFFSPPDILAGLFTLTGFEESEACSVIAPFSAGCGSIVKYPYLENKSGHPKAILGMFDVSARPCVDKNTLSFSIPMSKFVRMVPDMDESFLITDSWKKVLKRINKV